MMSPVSYGEPEPPPELLETQHGEDGRNFRLEATIAAYCTVD